MRKGLVAALFVSAAPFVSPAIAQTAPLAPVEQASLSKDAFATGLLGRDAGALPADLWRGAASRDLALLLAFAPSRPASPAIGDALRRVLLSAGDAPSDSSPALGGAKLKALALAGFIDEARQIESLADGANRDPASIEAMAIADILSNDVAAACDRGRRVVAGRENPFWVKLRVICYAANNELDAAELALGVLRENDALSAADEAFLAPLASGVGAKAPSAIEGPLHYAAMKVMKSPVDPALLTRADAGVLVALATDKAADWRVRADAARGAAAAGVYDGAKLKALYAGAPAGAVGAYADIRAMTAPELLRDKAGRIAAEIGAATSFDALYAAALLYADDIRALEGAIVPAGEAANFALARLAAGDAVGAERWLLSAAPGLARGAPEEQTMRFIDLVGVLGALEPAAAARVAAAANVAVASPRLAALSHDEPSSALAPIVGAAIDGALRGASGQSALAALAASGAAEKGDPVAAAVFARSLGAAGLGEIVRRRTVEEAIAAMYPAASGIGGATLTPSTTGAGAAADGVVPRLKPKQGA